MDAAIGIGLAFGAIFIAAILDGTSPASLFNISAMLLVFGGTIGVTIASYGLKGFLLMPKLLILAMKPRKSDPVALRAQMVGFAEKARREGLLALEQEVEKVEDDFVKRGLQMVIDGLEPDTVEEILQLEVEAQEARHQKGVQMLASMGGYAPTMGIIGTVMGLVGVLGKLSEPGSLGESIAVAFIATLWGVMSANVLWLPLSGNLKLKSQGETEERQMAIVAILALQAGDNPRIVAQKLESFEPPKLRGMEAKEGKSKGEKAPAEEAA